MSEAQSELLAAYIEKHQACKERIHTLSQQVEEVKRVLDLIAHSTSNRGIVRLARDTLDQLNEGA